MPFDERRWAGLFARVLAAECIGWEFLSWQVYTREDGLFWLLLATWTAALFLVAFLTTRLVGACVAVLGVGGLGFLTEPIGKWLVWGRKSGTWLAGLPSWPSFDLETVPCWIAHPVFADCTTYVAARFSASDQFALPLVAALALFFHPRAPTPAPESRWLYLCLAVLGPCAVAAWASLMKAGFVNGGLRSWGVPWGVVFAIVLSGWAALTCQRGWPRSRAVLALPASLLGLLPWLSWRDQLFTAEIGTAVGLTVAVTALLAWRASPRTLAVVALPALMLSFAGWWCWPHNGGVYGLLMTPFGTLAALLACEGVAPARAGPPG